MLHFHLLGPANEMALLITVRCASAVGHSNVSMQINVINNLQGLLTPTLHLGPNIYHSLVKTFFLENKEKRKQNLRCSKALPQQP